MTALIAALSPAPPSLREIDAALAYIDQTEREALAEMLRTTPSDETTERAIQVAHATLQLKLDATRQRLQLARAVARMRALL